MPVILPAEAIEEQAEMDLNILFTLIMANGLSTHTSKKYDQYRIIFICSSAVNNNGRCLFTRIGIFLSTTFDSNARLYRRGCGSYQKKERRCFITLLSMRLADTSDNKER